MAVFERNKPIITETTSIIVENKLQAGSHIFQLVVEDEDGNRSEPTRVTVMVTGAREIIDRERILTTIAENPGINITRLGEILRVNRNELKRELDKMIESRRISYKPRQGFFIVER